MEKILTVPEELKDEGKVYCTGNELVSLSHIGSDGTVHTASHLRESTLSLIEYSGEALLSLQLDGQPVPEGIHRYIHDFIPEFECEDERIALSRQIYAPPGIRGFGIRCTLRAKQAHSAKLQLVCRPEQVIRTVFHPHPLDAKRQYGYDSWSDTVYLEMVSGGGISALALGAQGCSKHWAEGILTLEKIYSLNAGDTLEVNFYISMGCELDGARLANVDMRRRGAALYRNTIADLDAHHISLPDPLHEQRANRNLAFCRYFSVGRTLDTDRLVLLTSRSGRYYVSGAYWARDCMLWAFPALLRWDHGLAREALVLACSDYLKEGANHALYMNGVNLYPGFELDQLVAPIIALERYLRVSGDSEILCCPQIRNAMDFTANQLKRWHDPESGLFATELSPSDDPCEYPFLTYNNFLTLSALRFLQTQLGGLEKLVAGLEDGIWKHCVKHDPEGDVFLWACNGKGGGELYDNPPGSLMLIPYYGGCPKTHPVWQNTYHLYFSRKNPWYTQNELLFGQGCEHAPSPWPMSLCNLLLSRGRDDRVLAALAAMEMDNGIACETVRAENGKACTGAAFATFAGFYANALIECYES